MTAKTCLQRQAIQTTQNLSVPFSKKATTKDVRDTTTPNQIVNRVMLGNPFSSVRTWPAVWASWVYQTAETIQCGQIHNPLIAIAFSWWTKHSSGGFLLRCKASQNFSTLAVQRCYTSDAMQTWHDGNCLCKVITTHSDHTFWLAVTLQPSSRARLPRALESCWNLWSF